MQSASGTYQDATDRAYMQTEVDELTAQIDQVITNTKFNGVALFDGTTAAVTVQTGANAADTVDLAMADLTTLAASGGAAGSYDVSTATAANSAARNARYRARIRSRARARRSVPGRAALNRWSTT